MKNYHKNDCIEVGIDEVGRGCMLGRVYTASVIWPIDYIEDKNFVIKDSKKLSKKEREKLYDYIIDTSIEWNVNYIENTEIDKIHDQIVMCIFSKIFFQKVSQIILSKD